MRDKLTERLLKGLKAQERPYRVHDSEVRGFHVRVQPSGVRSFCLDYRDRNGRRTTEILGRSDFMSVEIARDAAKGFLVDVARGEDPAELKRLARASTLRKFFDGPYKAWLTGNRKCGESTYVRLIKSFAPLLDKKPHELNAFELERWRAARKKAKPKLKNATLNRDVATLRAAINWGMRHGYIRCSEHPLKGLAALPQRDSKVKMRCLTDDEESRLFVALAEYEETLRETRDSFNKWRRERRYPLLPDLRALAFPSAIRPMLVVSLCTGVRRGELFALRWSDVDLDRRLLTVTPAAAKSGKARFIPMNGRVFETLKVWKSQVGGVGYVFENPQTKGPYGHVNGVWRKLLKAAKVNGFSWHDMRHTFASRLVQRGVDLYVVKELLGHSSIVLTERYSHLKPEHTRAAVALLEREPVSVASNVVEFKR
ncbi:MAG: site-specific integrase [Candidatus Hydrogenedentes bacterium]|nr:site-specific integrase [Candidatus Hydrogenedentota bacterium]